jgi:hypothetical protein
VYDPAFDAKHRHGLPDLIYCGKSAKTAWEKFSAALRKGMERRQDEDEPEDDGEDENEEEQDDTEESSDGRDEPSDDEEQEPDRQRQRANGPGKRTKRTK